MRNRERAEAARVSLGMGRRGLEARRARLGLEGLEDRRLMAAANLFFPPANVFPPADLIQPPVIHSQGGVLDASLNMVTAGFDSAPILYGGQPILSSPGDPNSPNNPNNPVYAMGYEVTAYGQTYQAQFPGPVYVLSPGETLALHVTDSLAPTGTAEVVFNTNLHAHGLHVSPLSDGDNVYREIVPGQGMDVSIFVPEDHAQGLNWYHVHRHGSTHDQVYGGLAGFLQVGDPLAPWPQYQDTITQVYLGMSEVNIQDGHLTNYLANKTGAQFWTGWQKRVNGQVNPTLKMQPGETQVWNMGSIGAFGGFNVAITDGNLANPWNATLLVQDGNGKHIQPYSLALAADSARMKDLAAATLMMPGNRLSMAVTAPTTPGTYYLIDGWGGQDKPAVVAGQQQFYVLATIEVAGDVVTETPVFGPVGEVDPLFSRVPDVQRTFEFSIIPGNTPPENQFLINGKFFGEGVMPQMQIGTVEEWTLTNPTSPLANANHPFHIHQGDFVVVAVNGVPVDPNATPPPAQSSLAYISGRDVIDIPSGGSVTIRFLVEDFPGKYVFHCHILKHEDQGMMSPVLAFGPADGLRLALGASETAARTVTVLNGAGDVIGAVTPFPKQYKGPIVTASALGASDYFDTMVVGTGVAYSAIAVYRDGALEPSARFRAFEGNAACGVSVAVGDLDADGHANIVVGSRGTGPAKVRIFDIHGNLLRELKGVLPGRFPNGVNVAVGDVNGDNFDDLIVGAGRGREPIVTAIDGQDIARGVEHPATLFTFRASGGPRAGARVAVGYVAPGSVPSYQANVITTAEFGPKAGLVEVWNSAELGTSNPAHDPHAGMAAMGSRRGVARAFAALSPMASFRPLGNVKRAVRIAASCQGLPGVPVIAAWRGVHRVALSAMDVENGVSTVVRRV